MNRAIIYIASGQQYIEEAVRSAESVRNYWDGDIIICSDYDIRATYPFSKSIEFHNRLSDYWYMDCVRFLSYIPSGYVFDELGVDIDQFLLLDTDTYICGDLTDFFTILDRFDLAGTQAIGRETMVQRDDIPASFPELHVGALSFRRNGAVRHLFEQWLEIYQDNPEFYGNNDQGPLREALWKSPDVRLGILPAEFCFRYRWGGLVNGQVRVLHGRENNTPYEQIAEEVNSKGIRVYQKRELA